MLEADTGSGSEFVVCDRNPWHIEETDPSSVEP
ncbi:MAG: hypothetical protein K0S56_2686 [Microvirga sp.]|jgi:hypothetical protein|nr:hypothetical protein [Microvirga sp.]